MAQKYFAPGEVSVAEMGTENPMRFDVRLLVYGGRILWVSARVDKGQATNFITPVADLPRCLFSPKSIGLSKRQFRAPFISIGSALKSKRCISC